MRKFIVFLMMMFVVVSTSAQKDVTTFLGIPVDGFKSEMRKKLIDKGFTPIPGEGDSYLEGEFNGTDVYLSIVTNNNKVYRITLLDKNSRNEADIKVRFNTLVRQFENNARYVTPRSFTISEDEDISYEMMVNNKIYEASFYQNVDFEKVDTLALQNYTRQELLKQFTEEQIANNTHSVQNAFTEIAANFFSELLLKKSVWFRISERYGKYYIAMYYDNEYNHANGEDL